MDSQIYFKQKYLKYKQKYLENKKILGGGPSLQRPEQERLELEQKRLEREQERVEYVRFRHELEQKKKKDLIFSLNNLKLKNEECTAMVLKKQCKNAIIEFNNYIDQEINYLSTNYLLPVTYALNNLLETVSNSSDKKIISDYIILRGTHDFTGVDHSSVALTNKLFISLREIITMIKSL